MSGTIPCSHCRGSGRVALSGIYADTLDLLHCRLGKEVTGADLARVAGCQATAMNNRLAWLERHGLATSRRYGRLRLYRTPANGDGHV